MSTVVLIDDTNAFGVGARAEEIGDRRAHPQTINDKKMVFINTCSITKLCIILLTT